MTETIFAGKMPILALRGLCVFPEQTVHFEVGRSKSVKALEAAMQGDQTLLLIPQKDLLVDDPTLKDLYGVGCIAKVKQVLKTQGENLRILVTGISRGKITELSQSEPYLSGIVESASVEEPADTIRARALRREANSLYGVYLELCEHPAQTVQLRMLASESSGFIADSIAQNSGIDFPDKAKMLCQLNSVRRLETAVQLLRREVEMLRLEGDIQEKTRAAIDQNQKDYFLREQMKAIREELGEEDDEDEFDTYAQSIQNLHLEAETEKKLEALLCQIDGAGAVDVMLTLADGGEAVYQVDETVRDGGREEQTVLADKAPVLVQTRQPRFQGAVVVCEGADRAAVKLAVTEAVASLTGLGSGKIAFVKMKSSN